VSTTEQLSGESQEIDAFLVSEEIEAETDEGNAEEAPEDEEADTAEDEAGIEADDPEDGEDADEGEEDEAEDEEADDEPDDLIAVKVDGEEVKVTLEQLKSGYSGQAKIQKGLQEVAAKRKEAEALQTSLQAAQEQFLGLVEQVQRNGVMRPPQAPDPNLATTDPAAYVRQRAQYDAQMGQYQQQQAQIQHQQRQKTEAENRARAAYLQEQVLEVQRSIPEFSDPRTAEEMRQNMTRIGQSEYNFSAEEIDGVMDARYVKALADAVRYQMLKKSTPAAKKQEPKRTVKPAARRPEKAGQKSADLLKRAAKTQSPDDWERLLMTPD
jgi:hypothetical protein